MKGQAYYAHACSILVRTRVRTCGISHRKRSNGVRYLEQIVYCHNFDSHMTAKGAAMIIRTDSSKYEQVSSFWSHSLLHAMTNGCLRH